MMRVTTAARNFYGIWRRQFCVDSRIDYSKLTVKELSIALKDRNLKSSGRKVELVQRLEQDDTKRAHLTESKKVLTPAERMQHLREIIAEKEQERLQRKGLAAKIENNLYRSPLMDPDEDESEDLLQSSYVLQPREHNHTIIWLHGLNESNDKAKTMFQMISPKNTRVVVPNAPKIPLTALDEDEVRAWWDIEYETSQADIDDEEDTIGIRESHKALLALMEYEESLVGSENLLLAGFGQGAALALHTMLRYPSPLAGVMSWAGYVVEQDKYPVYINEANQATKVLAYHGKNDDVVKPKLALQGIQDLKSYGIPVETRLVPRMGHYIDQAQWVQGYNWSARQF